MPCFYISISELKLPCILNNVSVFCISLCIDSPADFVYPKSHFNSIIFLVAPKNPIKIHKKKIIMKSDSIERKKNYYFSHSCILHAASYFIFIIYFQFWVIFITSLYIQIANILCFVDMLLAMCFLFYYLSMRWNFFATISLIIHLFIIL